MLLELRTQTARALSAGERALLGCALVCLLAVGVAGSAAAQALTTRYSGTLAESFAAPSRPDVERVTFALRFAGSETGQLERAKRNARATLPASVTSALYPCLLAGSGAALLGLPPGILPGGVLVVIALPLCDHWAQTIRAEAETVSDPPRADYTTLARATPTTARVTQPSCADLNGRRRSLCARLESAAAGYLAAVQRVMGTWAALEITVARDSAAANAGDRSALSLQENEIATLMTTLRPADNAEAAAGALLATVLRQAGAPLALTTDQARAAIGRVKTRLVGEGMTAAELVALGGSSLIPRPLDEAAQLGS